MKNKKLLKYIECESGWYDLIEELHNKLLTIDPNYRIDQIKEKFGLLRYYFTTENSYDEMNKIVDEYEAYSGQVCEFCGDPGKLANFGGWFKTSCVKCLEKSAQDNPGTTHKFTEKSPVIKLEKQ